MGFFPLITIFLAFVLAILWKREPRSMLNAGVFGVLLVFGYIAIMELAFNSDRGAILYSYMAVALFIGVPLLYLIGSLLLILNGRTMIRNEGRSLSHLLSPLVGSIPMLIVLAVIVGGFIALLGQEEASILTMSILGLAVALYGYMLWTAWYTILYGAFYTLMPKTSDPDAIIVHGAGLINGDVTPLLASRLDKALDLYGRGGHRAIIIPSGAREMMNLALKLMPWRNTSLAKVQIQPMLCLKINRWIRVRIWRIAS